MISYTSEVWFAMLKNVTAVTCFTGVESVLYLLIMLSVVTLRASFFLQVVL